MGLGCSIRVRLESKTSNAQNEEMLSGLPRKADLRSAWQRLAATQGGVPLGKNGVAMWGRGVHDPRCATAASRPCRHPLPAAVPVVIPSPTADVRSNCSHRTATATPSRSCSRAGSRSRRWPWSSLYAPGLRPRPPSASWPGQGHRGRAGEDQEAGRRVLGEIGFGGINA